MAAPWRVSVHGGHSGQFCQHATDSLAEVVAAYTARDFRWVGLTEHIPPPDDSFLYADQRALGLTAVDLQNAFANYIALARQLQADYADRLVLAVGFETEGYAGYAGHVADLVAAYQPDYIVGSIHHVANQPFDLSADVYRKVAQSVGGLDTLYALYFDRQLEMIEQLRPAVVGHLDYIRKYDPDYQSRLQQPAIWARIERNLAAIKAAGLYLDFNARAWHKGQPEPYVAAPIAAAARALDIPLIPSDDSHGLDTVGLGVDRALALLQTQGAPVGEAYFAPLLARLAPARS